MKKIILMIITALSIIVSGCKSIPTEDSVMLKSLAIGRGAGQVVMKMNLDDETKTTIVEVVSKASNTPFGKDGTFSEKWTPTANKIIERLINDKKITLQQSVTIKGGFQLACAGMDYIVTKKYTNLSNYEDLIKIAIDGFVNGFNSVVNPQMSQSFKCVAYDEDAYKYLENYNLK
jgi:hypothetical protein